MALSTKLALVLPILWPLAYIFNLCRPKTPALHRRVKAAKERRRRKEVDPEPLPAKRERSLTLPLPPASKSSSFLPRRGLKQNTVGQMTSSFFCKLPAEVRTMIYKEVLCGPVGMVHIEKGKDGILRQFRCIYTPEEREEDSTEPVYIHVTKEQLRREPQYGHRCALQHRMRGPQDKGDIINGGYLPLLQTCRLV